MKIKLANGVTGHIIRTGNVMMFRVYDENQQFTDYDLNHSDLCVTIRDEDSAFYSDPQSDSLDHSPETLGIK
jgi:tRNA splicing endonuclease